MLFIAVDYAAAGLHFPLTGEFLRKDIRYIVNRANRCDGFKRGARRVYAR